MLLNIKIIPLKIILVLLNSIIMLHTVKRNDPKVKQKDYSNLNLINYAFSLKEKAKSLTFKLVG